MKFNEYLNIQVIIILLVFLSACSMKETQLKLVETESFNAENVILDDDLSEGDRSIKNIKLHKRDDFIVEQIEMIYADLRLYQENKLINDYVNAVNAYFESDLITFFQNPPRDSIVINKWFALNLDLFKESGDTRYAEALQNIVDNKTEAFINDKTLKKAICTRKYDKVFVNLFVDADLSYRHTTGGVVSFQIKKTDDNHIEILFNNPDKRYVDLYIRIPEDAKKASVNVGGVKYKAVPGEYCLVSKKWKKGNLAVIDF